MHFLNFLNLTSQLTKYFIASLLIFTMASKKINVINSRSYSLPEFSIFYILTSVNTRTVISTPDNRNQKPQDGRSNGTSTHNTKILKM